MTKEEMEEREAQKGKFEEAKAKEDSRSYIEGNEAQKKRKWEEDQSRRQR